MAHKGRFVAYFDGLAQWDDQLVYSEPLRTVVAYAFGAGARDAGEWYPAVLDR